MFHEPDGAVRALELSRTSSAKRAAWRTRVLGTGAGKDSRVGILMGNRPEWVAAAVRRLRSPAPSPCR